MQITKEQPSLKQTKMQKDHHKVLRFNNVNIPIIIIVLL